MRTIQDSEELEAIRMAGKAAASAGYRLCLSQSLAALESAFKAASERPDSLRQARIREVIAGQAERLCRGAGDHGEDFISDWVRRMETAP